MLSEAEKSDIRRHLNYPMIGMYRQSPVGGTLAPLNNGMRWFNSWGQIEYRMSNMLPNEEARVTGKPYGSIGFSQSNPLEYLIPIDPGSTFTISLTSTLFSSNPVHETYTVTATDTFLTICGNVSQQFALNGVFASAGFIALNDFGSGPYGLPNNANQLVTFPLVSFLSPLNGGTFSIAVSGTGSTIPQIMQQGLALNPTLTSNLTFPATKIYGYVPILNYLEDQLAGSVSDNLSVLKGNNATLRTSEMKDRQKLYNFYRNRLALFFGVPINPLAELRDSSKSGSWSVA